MIIKGRVIQKIISVFSSVLLLVNSFSPFLVITPTVFAAEPLTANITYDSGKNSFTISANTQDSVNYVLIYKDNNQIEAVKGSADASSNNFSRDIYAGTCSSGVCKPNFVQRGILLMQNPARNWLTEIKFSISDGKLIAGHPTVPSSLDLTDADITWLNSGPDITPNPTPSPWTFEKVELNKEYIYPQNSGVKLTFTKLPNPSGNIKIEEITLTEDQMKQTGSLSDKAYDITSDMADGSFTYNLSLPIPESAKDKPVEVKFAEDISKIASAEKVENNLTKTENSVSVTNLDHMTIFVVVLNSSPPPESFLEIIVDNTDPEFSVLSGNWRDSTSVSGWYGSNYKTTDERAGTEQVKWEFQVKESGSHEVYAWWTAHSNRGTAVPYTINYEGGSDTVLVDQEQNGGKWNLLGTYNFNAGVNYSVILTNNTTDSSNYVIADAIKVRSTEAPNEVWVDDDWIEETDGNVVDDGKIFGYNAFSTIQDAIAQVASGGTINVAAGTYTEIGQIVINKNLSIIGADKTTTIIKPA